MVTKAMGLERGLEAGVRIFCFDDLGRSTTGFRNDYSVYLPRSVAILQLQFSRCMCLS
jgi:hypothetical protein